VRIHAAELAKAARAAEAVFAKGRVAEAPALAELASSVGSRLDRLSRTGSNRTEQRRLAAQLIRAAAEASKLGKRR
jgi:hypothetical protein